MAVAAVELLSLGGYCGDEGFSGRPTSARRALSLRTLRIRFSVKITHQLSCSVAE